MIFRRKYLKHQAIATIEKEQEKNEIKKEKKKPWKTAESAIRKTERQPLNYLSCCLKKLASNWIEHESEKGTRRRLFCAVEHLATGASAAAAAESSSPADSTDAIDVVVVNENDEMIDIFATNDSEDEFAWGK